ncbi:MAG: choice-of-anchor D domain-containing protein [Candidatus Eiseniibacteriota bacterium]
MRRLVRFGLFAWLVASSLVTLSFARPVFAQSDYVPGEVLIRYRPTATSSSINAIESSLGADRIQRFAKLRIDHLKISKITVEEALLRYRNDPSVDMIEPNAIYHAFVTPNDPSFGFLWGMNNTGQSGGRPGADISALDAWDVFTGSTSAPIGVIDTGVDYTHPDLAANVWTNPNEIPNNFVDDDENGFVDDVRGWDFVNGDNDPFDDNGHGTHVSGTIGAVGNNGVGVVGVNWNARIVGIKSLNAFGTGSSANAIAAVNYAATIGLRVVNASWGGGTPSTGLHDAIAAFGSAGGLFIAAAGNAGQNIDLFPTYPASFDLENILTVAATDHNDLLAGFSNWGLTTVDLAAPGSDILSTVPGGGYFSASGTSMATPHVTGAAALVLGRFPGMAALDVKGLLMATVDPVPALAGLVGTGGRLNAFMPIAEPDSTAPDGITDLAVAEAGGQSLALRFTAPGDDANVGTVTRYDIRYSTSPITDANFLSATPVPTASLPAPLPAGSLQELTVTGLAFSTTYYLAARAHDEFGNPSALSNQATGTTLAPPDITIAPASLEADLLTGQTAVRTLTVGNTGESELSFAIDIASPDSALAIDVVPRGASGPQAILGHGTPVPLAELATRTRPFQSQIEVESKDTGDDLHGKAGGSGKGVVSGKFAVESGPGRVVLSPTEEVFGDPFFFFLGGFRMRGNIFHCTNERMLREHRFFMRPLPGTEVWFVVYEGVAPVGLFSLVSASRIPSTGSDEGWYSSGPVDLSLTPGRYYLILASFDQSSEYYGSDFLPVYPIPASFGSLIAGAGATWGPSFADPPSPTQVVPDFAYGTPVAYYQTLVTDVNVTWFTVEPVAGTVPAASGLDVHVTFDAAGLNGGGYDARLIVTSNDPDESSLGVPVHLSVTGAPDVEVTPLAIDFGTHFVGATRTDSVEVRNAGTDLLTISGVSATPGVFQTETAGFTLVPGERRALPVRFVPNVADEFTGSLTASSNDPDEAAVAVSLQGRALLPPEITVTPESLSVALLSGEQEVRLLTLSNTGVSDLEFSIELEETTDGSVLMRPLAILPAPVPADPGQGPAEGETPARTDRPPADYVVAASTPRAVDGARVLLVQDVLPWGRPSNELALQANNIPYDVSGTLQLGSLDLSAYKVIIVSSDQTTQSYANLAAFEGLLAAFVSNGGRLEFHAAAWGFNSGNAGLVTLPGGVEISLYYSTLNYIQLPNHALVVGLESPIFGSSASHSYLSNVPPNANVILTDEVNRPALVEYRYGRGKVIAACQTLEFYASAPGHPISTLHARLIPYVYLGSGVPWLSGDPLDGTIPPGGSAQIAFTFDAEGRLGGEYRANLLVSSNDPDEEMTIVPARMSVTGVPDIAVLGGRHTIESLEHYSGTGATTLHDLFLPVPPGGGGSIQLYVNGDYGEPTETATLYVEGDLIGSAGSVFFACMPDSEDLVLSASTLGAYASDGVVHALVQNSVNVEPFCGTEEHRVRLTYRGSTSPFALGVHFVGTCHSDSIEIRNPGTDILYVSSITSSHAAFVPGITIATLEPGTSAIIPISFCPATGGPLAATLTIESNDPETPSVVVNMTGMGARPPDIAVLPEELAFELGPNEVAEAAVQISNTGGGPLVWRAEVEPPGAAAAPGGAPIIATAVAPEESRREHRLESAPSGIAPDPAPNGSAEPGLEAVLSFLDAGHEAITAIIPNRFDFDGGVKGLAISDGGLDMYDGGNILGTNPSFVIPYSDGVIQNHSQVGPLGRYFTRKYPGLFLFAGDLDGRTEFHIQGGLGADGFGAVDGAVLEQALGGRVYRGFVKRVWGAGVPSVNHLVIVSDSPFSGHSFSTDTNQDRHAIFGFSGPRVYYLLFATTDGSYVPNETVATLMDRFLRTLAVETGWLTVAPVTGGTPAGGVTQAMATVRSAGLLGGDYSAVLAFESNDPDEPRKTVTARLRVIGIPDITVLPPSLVFGQVFVGNSVRDSVVVRNDGTDVLHVSGVSAAPGAFTVDPSDFSLPPGVERKLLVTFAPGAAGIVNGTLTVTSDDPDEGVAVIALHGEGLLPPDIAVSPESLSVSLLTGQSTTRTLTISNTGASDLVVLLEIEPLPGRRPATPSETIRSGDVRLAAAGSRPIRTDVTQSSQSPPPPGYAAQSVTPRTTIGSSVLLIQDYSPWGQVANEEILTDAGILYDVSGTFTLHLVDYSAYRTIIVAGDQSTPSYSNLAAQAGRLASFVAAGGILEFHAAGWGWNNGNASLVPLPGGVTVHHNYAVTNYVALPAHPLVAGLPLVLHGNSASQCHLSNLPASATTILTDDQFRPTLVEYRHGAGRVLVPCQPLEFYWPFVGNPFRTLHTRIPPYANGSGVEWISVNPEFAKLPPGASADVTVTFDANGLFGGDYGARIVVLSDDPDEPEIGVPARLHVTGATDIEVNPPALNFGSVFVGLSRSESLFVRNAGTGLLHVTGLDTSPAAFSADPAPFDLAPGEGQALLVHFAPTAPGPIAGSLTFHSNDPDEPDLVVPLAGDGLPPPDIGVDPESLQVTLTTGSSETRVLTLSNAGIGHLFWTSSVSFAPLRAGGAAPAIEGASRSAARTTSAPDPAHAPRGGSGLTDLLAARNRAVQNGVVLFSDDMENGTNGWTTETYGGSQDLWHQTGRAYNSPSNSWWCGIEDSGNYDNGAIVLNAAITPPIDLRAHPDSVRLEFFESFVTEAFWDLCVVDVSTDSAGWQTVRSGLTGNSGGWRLTIVDLSAFAGQVIRIRFLFNTQDASSNGFPGWFFDDVRVVANAGPWLAVEPGAGGLAPGATTPIEARFSAAELTDGSYAASILFTSNDPDEGILFVPASLDVFTASALAVETVPERFELSAVTPNPGIGRVRAEFAMPRPGTARAEIFDVAGRRVRMLVEGEHPAGRHPLVWQGEGDDGTRSAAGVYLLKLSTPEGVRVRRFVWVP